MVSCSVTPELGVEALEFDVGALRREAPVDGRGRAIMVLLPGADFRVERGHVGETPLEALAREDTEVNLGDVEPAACLDLWWISSLSAKRLASAGGKASYPELAVVTLLRMAFHARSPRARPGTWMSPRARA